MEKIIIVRISQVDKIIWRPHGIHTIPSGSLCKCPSIKIFVNVKSLQIFSLFIAVKATTPRNSLGHFLPSQRQCNTFISHRVVCYTELVLLLRKGTSSQNANCDLKIHSLIFIIISPCRVLKKVVNPPGKDINDTIFS